MAAHDRQKPSPSPGEGEGRQPTSRRAAAAPADPADLDARGGLAEEIRRLDGKVDAVLELLQRVTASGPTGKRLLSRRAAGRRLGIDRGLLPALIDAGHLRTVVVNGREYIPAAEVERFAAEGERLKSRKQRAPATGLTGKAGADALRASLRRQ
jgi:hypothetical protein